MKKLEVCLTKVWIFWKASDEQKNIRFVKTNVLAVLDFVNLYQNLYQT